jgi:hypothetical protein
VQPSELFSEGFFIGRRKGDEREGYHYYRYALPSMGRIGLPASRPPHAAQPEARLSEDATASPGLR